MCGLRKAFAFLFLDYIEFLEITKKVQNTSKEGGMICILLGVRLRLPPKAKDPFCVKKV